MQIISGKNRILSAVAAIALSAFILSFSVWGGDNYKIYLNNRLVLEQHVTQQAPVKSFQLYKSAYNGELEVVYSHCGEVGKGRSIAIKDDDNNILKQWRFPNAAGNNPAMICKVKDIIALQKQQESGKLNLYYASEQLPKGKLLATIILSNDVKATP